MCEIRNLRMQIVWHDTKECMPPAVKKNYLCAKETYDGTAFVQELSFNPQYMAFNADSDGNHIIPVRYWAEVPKIADIDHRASTDEEEW